MIHLVEKGTFNYLNCFNHLNWEYTYDDKKVWFKLFIDTSNYKPSDTKIFTPLKQVTEFNNILDHYISKLDEIEFSEPIKNPTYLNYEELLNHHKLINVSQIKNLDISHITNTSHMLRYTNINETFINNLDFSRVISSKGMFQNSRYKHIQFKKQIAYKLTDMTEMFKQCQHLETLDLSQITAPSLKTMDDIIEGCKALKVLKLPKYNLNDDPDHIIKIVSFNKNPNLYVKEIHSYKPYELVALKQKYKHLKCIYIVEDENPTQEQFNYYKHLYLERDIHLNFTNEKAQKKWDTIKLIIQ